ncbi:UDP-N-acetylmuramoyl-tripeptide--D-alanyl-D-alanine ligase [Spiractinospora alimapuensis]|uniref:UDP-N-acetylmuramoyl-tripeptide--D-alanyl-D- alanine ligase n=1 Tax=Spiractinospora alimapuensis TaxID=2820884 RepID=UPI001F3990A6|nr:UDP-N-acetylmuramoyl-tripeptide--D-alanyl-D-alanine ligase [Spiractinospora alimapuensis]QVQ53135.1 UDP-N-acetylmuramoyl-tripeptide--D-alanyl-D-alanine ligase [Spiractinospora alimapuensis]
MVVLPLDRIAAVTQSRLLPGDSGREETVDGPVVIDSREVVPGALFVALTGERVDGHDFVAAAARAGAAAALVSRPTDTTIPQFVVDDGDAGVLDALGRLARHTLDALPHAQVMAVTGSSGKTTTKDLLAQVVAPQGPTVAPVGSFNNEIGLPLTVLKSGPDTRFVVLEAAARGTGHIAHLCDVAPPRIGIVLNVGTAHLGEFGSREAVAKAKGELVEALPDAEHGGVAVLNADDPAVAAMSTRTTARVVRYGRTPDADVHAENVVLDAGGRPRFTLVTPEGRGDVALALAGEHQVHNALAVAAAARELGLAPGEIAAALTDARAKSRWRMEVSERADGVTVVNDAYNANPESTEAALRTLRTMVEATPGRRAVAVLGHMAELGDGHDVEHERVGRLAAELGVGVLVTVGSAAEPIAAGAATVTEWPGETRRVVDSDDAVTSLSHVLRPGDIVLVKGSRVTGLEQLAQRLTAEGGTQ